MVAQTVASWLTNKKIVLYVQATVFQFANGALYEANHIIPQLDIHTDAEPTIQLRNGPLCSLHGYDVVLGMDWLRHTNPQIEWATMRMS